MSSGHVNFWVQWHSALSGFFFFFYSFPSLSLPLPLLLDFGFPRYSSHTRTHTHTGFKKMKLHLQFSCSGKKKKSCNPFILPQFHVVLASPSPHAVNKASQSYHLPHSLKNTLCAKKTSKTVLPPLQKQVPLHYGGKSIH